jgi:glycine cleavage system transcriptional repressor
MMATPLLLTIDCPDRAGLVAAITGTLFKLGANLGDTTFTLLGTSAEFTAVCDLPANLHPETLTNQFGALPELQGADIKLNPIGLSPIHGTRLEATHQITVWGDHQPGVIACLSRVFTDFDAHIVRLNATKIPAPIGGEARYSIQLSVWISQDRAEACLTAIADAAGTLRLRCKWAQA